VLEYHNRRKVFGEEKKQKSLNFIKLLFNHYKLNAGAISVYGLQKKLTPSELGVEMRHYYYKLAPD